MRAYIVSKPEDYKWSSYRFHAFGEDEEKLLDNDAVYLSLPDTNARKQEAYRDFTALERNESIIKLIKNSIEKDTVLGTEVFVETLRDKIGRWKLRPRGRPRKRNN